MKTKMLSFSILAIAFLCQCTVSPSANRNLRATSDSRIGPANAKPGACYAKCLIPDQVSTDEQFIAVYTGDEAFEEVDLETKTMIIKPASQKWGKKKADRNCLSEDPNDCLVWCLVDVPAETETYKILKDTTQSPNYTMTSVQQEKLLAKGGFTEWKEVLCPKQITKSLISQIQTALMNQAFYKEALTSSFDTKTKAALSDFQRANNLPVGQLDLETMDALGVIIN